MFSFSPKIWCANSGWNDSNEFSSISSRCRTETHKNHTDKCIIALHCMHVKNGHTDAQSCCTCFMCHLPWRHKTIVHGMTIVLYIHTHSIWIRRTPERLPHSSAVVVRLIGPFAVFHAWKSKKIEVILAIWRIINDTVKKAPNICHWLVLV